MSAFWKHFDTAKSHVASAADDIRHKLVEEGWFVRTEGREVTEEIKEWTPKEKAVKAERVHSGEATPMHRHATLYEEVWGKGPDGIEGEKRPGLPGPQPRLPGPDQDPDNGPQLGY